MIRRIFNSLTAPFRRSTILSKLRQGVFTSTVSGVTVNQESAMKLAAWYASVRVISETRGSLPIRVYERLKSGRRAQVTLHGAAQLLATEPNPDMTPMVMAEVETAGVLGWGNSYTEAVWDNSGEIVALIPRAPSLVTPYRSPSGDLMYRVESDYTVGSSGATRHLDRSQMLHVPGLGPNGIMGWSPVRMAAESLGVALGQEQMAASFFGNKAKPGIVISLPGTIDDAKFAALKRSLDQDYSNENAFRSLLLEGGATVTSLSMPMNEAQFLESREFQGEEIACRWFRLPPHVVGYLRRATFSNIEAQDLYFEKHTMRPWLVRYEQEYNRKLFARKDWGRFYVKHNVDALLRADIKTRYEAYKTAILSGFKSQNEVRELEDLDPVDGGDELLKPEAIFGKSGGKQDGKTPPPPKSRGKLDRRLVALTEQVLEGLLHREVVAVQRAAGKSDFRHEMTQFYEKHVALVEDRLSPLQCDAGPAVEAVLSRRDAVLALDGEMAQRAAQTWTVGDVSRRLLQRK